MYFLNRPIDTLQNKYYFQYLKIAHFTKSLYKQIHT